MQKGARVKDTQGARSRQMSDEAFRAVIQGIQRECDKLHPEIAQAYVNQIATMVEKFRADVAARGGSVLAERVECLLALLAGYGMTMSGSRMTGSCSSGDEWRPTEQAGEWAESTWDLVHPFLFSLPEAREGERHQLEAGAIQVQDSFEEDQEVVATLTDGTRRAASAEERHQLREKELMDKRL